MKSTLTFLVGLVLGAALCAAIPMLVLASGVVNMAATTKPGLLERTLAPWAVDRSRARRAPTQNNPDTATAAVLATGLEHYRANCVMCHGAPGVDAAELEEGLNPSPPVLQSSDTEGMSDGDLFWTIKNGVRMTGMPAFGPTHTDEEIWTIVAFVRHLPNLTDAEKADLEAATDESHHHAG